MILRPLGHPMASGSVFRLAVGFAGVHSGALEAFARVWVVGIAGEHGSELALRVGIPSSSQILAGLINLACVLAGVQIAVTSRRGRRRELSFDGRGLLDLLYRRPGYILRAIHSWLGG